jgi:hypothetical protein
MDAAVLLDVEPSLVRNGSALGLRKLTTNLARMQGWNRTKTYTALREGQCV